MSRESEILIDAGRRVAAAYEKAELQNAFTLEVHFYNKYVKNIDTEDAHRLYFSQIEASALSLARRLKGVTNRESESGNERTLIVSHNGQELAHNLSIIEQVRNIKNCEELEFDVLLLTETKRNVFNENQHLFSKVINGSSNFQGALKNYIEYLRTWGAKNVLWNSAPPLASFFLAIADKAGADGIYFSMRYRSLMLGGTISHLCFTLPNSEHSRDAQLEAYRYLPHPLAEMVGVKNFPQAHSDNYASDFLCINRGVKINSMPFISACKDLLQTNKSSSLTYTFTDECDVLKEQLLNCGISESRINNIKWYNFGLDLDLKGVALDTFPFAGGLTSLWLMEMGIPVVSHGGSGLSIFFPKDVVRIKSPEDLKALPQGEACMIAACNDAEYIALAKAIANDRKIFSTIVYGQFHALASLSRCRKKNCQWLIESLKHKRFQ